ncbi:MAG TPA: sigma 54-interacting transcriptional regulator, partial [Bryobacteraceae bacterium]
SASNRRFVSAVAKLLYANPFLPEVLDYEREALGNEAMEEESVWSMTVSDPDRIRANTWRIVERLTPLVKDMRQALVSGTQVREPDLLLYEDALLFFFYYRYYQQFVVATFRPREKARWGFYRDFTDEWNFYFHPPGITLPTGYVANHTFACYYQVVRAFHHIFEQIIGSSQPAARLRAAIWQSIFTHDIRRYRRTLFNRMSEFATLITGPSGTGKELVARSIALSRYVPFDETRLAFEQELDGLFFPINIAALPGTLVESELFGHKRGSFTGAVQDKKGWLEACPALGAVFLDEIGELDIDIQVKLLRVIETRCFQALGDSSARTHRFEGKLIAATNRNLAQAIRKNRFREDLYYRLCSDQIRTPSLRQQIDESPGVLQDLILFMSRRVGGNVAEALARETGQWIEKNLDPRYQWPGNYRELEQCVRNILIRKEYQISRPAPRVPKQDVFGEARTGGLTASELLSRYCTLVYSQTGSYEETARRLEMDRRTVKAKVNRDLLNQLATARAATAAHRK